jgi:hypothetical protein
VADLDALPPDAPPVLLSTGTLVGVGFDHPRLDTPALAMPVPRNGTLQPYATPWGTGPTPRLRGMKACFDTGTSQSFRAFVPRPLPSAEPPLAPP